ncbi:MAG TPA: SDR family oxidoreductase [Actinotalea sp.]
MTETHTHTHIDVPRTAVVTGAGRGIGRAIALGLAVRGYDVALVGRTAAHLEEVAAEIARAASAPRTVVVPVDLVDATGVREAAATIQAELGGIGLLVNNAGVIEHRELPFDQDDPEDDWRVIETNVRGPMLITHALLGGMLAQGGARIVNINSGAGHRGTSTYTGYAISKGALARFTTQLDTQYRDRGLRVFDVAPGVVATDMTASMPTHDDRTEWTPVEEVVSMVAAIASGDLDALSGRFLRCGDDSPAELAARTYDILITDARRLRLVRYGAHDPLIPTGPTPGTPPLH